MTKKIKLDKYEKDIEDNFASLQNIPNMDSEVTMLQKVAASHIKRKKSSTL